MNIFHPGNQTLATFTKPFCRCYNLQKSAKIGQNWWPEPAHGQKLVARAWPRPKLQAWYLPSPWKTWPDPALSCPSTSSQETLTLGIIIFISFLFRKNQWKMKIPSIHIVPPAMFVTSQPSLPDDVKCILLLTMDYGYELHLTCM